VAERMSASQEGLYCMQLIKIRALDALYMK